jgi:hypothetical protein
MIQQQLLFYLGPGLLVAGVVLLYIGASLVSFPVACAYLGCPSTAIYWDEVYTGNQHDHCRNQCDDCFHSQHAAS